MPHTGAEEGVKMEINPPKLVRLMLSTAFAEQWELVANMANAVLDEKIGPSCFLKQQYAETIIRDGRFDITVDEHAANVVADMEEEFLQTYGFEVKKQPW